jgi:hypothetical protein
VKKVHSENMSCFKELIVVVSQFSRENLIFYHLERERCERDGERGGGGGVASAVLFQRDLNRLA